MRYLTLILTFFSLGVYCQNEDYSAEVQTNYNEGVLAYSNQNYPQAKVLFNTCIQQDPNCFEAYLGLGQIQLIEQDYAAVLQTCQKGEKVRPFDADLYSLMGRSYFEIKEYTQAEFFLKRALSLDKTKKDDNVYLALTLQKSGNYKESTHYFDQALSAKPDETSIWIYRGDLYLEMELYEKALTDFRRALKLSPKNATVCIRLAKTLMATEKYSEANEYIDLGLETANTKEQIGLHVIRGNYYRQSNKLNEAIESYELAHQLAPTNPIILTHQAAAFIDAENFEEAIEKCDAAIALAPALKEAYFNRGIAREMVRDVDGACSDWQEAFILGSQEAIEYLNGSVCNE